MGAKIEETRTPELVRLYHYTAPTTSHLGSILPEGVIRTTESKHRLCPPPRQPRRPPRRQLRATAGTRSPGTGSQSPGTVTVPTDSTLTWQCSSCTQTPMQILSDYNAGNAMTIDQVGTSRQSAVSAGTIRTCT